VSATRHASEALQRLEGFVSRPRGLVVLFAVAVLVYAVRAIAWPLEAGRDLDEYLYAWVQLFDRNVLLPWSLLWPSLALTAVGLAGFAVGLRVQERLDQRSFNRAVLGFLALLGAWLLIRSLW